jgi:digeranylgeranylglycerophospholipid reductase
MVIRSAGGGRPDVLVVGGAMAGLAAAERLRAVGDVTLHERQSYDDKRVNCGEAINDASLVPLDPTPENGFVNDVDGFELRTYDGTDRPAGTGPLATARLGCEPGYVCDRTTVERRWAERLRERGVDVREAAPLTTTEYRERCGEYDLVVDATGQPSLTSRAFGLDRGYTGDMVALNAEVEGAFDAYESWPRIYFEGYVGYAWSFPKSATRANVGIGWAGDERPDDYHAAFAAACRRNGLPVPDRGAVNADTIPRGPSLDPAATHLPEHGVFLVGDAAGIANRYQGEGICQAIRSAHLLADLVERGAASTYPERLHRLMRGEYRLAHLMRGAWVEHEDPTLLGAVAAALDGLTIDEITRQPRAVIRRLLARPRLAARLVADRGMVRRIVDAYAGRWEYDRPTAG